MSASEQALGRPAIEVVAKAKRRRFTGEYKRKIVREADGCKTPGAVGALLRRGGVFSLPPSHLRPGRGGGGPGGGAQEKGAPPAGRLSPPQKVARQSAVVCRVAEVYESPTDDCHYLCSERRMYRLLAANAEVRERRDQLRHPRYAAPELLARRPNELWSWDITKLLGPAKWTYFHLYVMLEVFSRYVVGWMVSHGENAALAEQFIRATCDRQGIGRDQLTIHADRGQAMVSKSVAFLLADLGVTKTHSRPHVSNDNPFSEAQFKTLKYRPAFPELFGSLQDRPAHGHVFLR